MGEEDGRIEDSDYIVQPNGMFIDKIMHLCHRLTQ